MIWCLRTTSTASWMPVRSTPSALHASGWSIGTTPGRKKPTRECPDTALRPNGNGWNWMRGSRTLVSMSPIVPDLSMTKIRTGTAVWNRVETALYWATKESGWTPKDTRSTPIEAVRVFAGDVPYGNRVVEPERSSRRSMTRSTRSITTGCTKNSQSKRRKPDGWAGYAARQWNRYWEPYWISWGWSGWTHEGSTMPTSMWWWPPWVITWKNCSNSSENEVKGRS